MQRNDKAVIVYTTCPSLEVAKNIAGALVERGHAACVNILPRMLSIYAWNLQIQHDDEVAMLVKTQAKAADAAIATIKELHPYDIPAALVLPVEGGCETFLQWISEQTDGAP